MHRGAGCLHCIRAGFLLLHHLADLVCPLPARRQVRLHDITGLNKACGPVAAQQSETEACQLHRMRSHCFRATAEPMRSRKQDLWLVLVLEVV